MRIWGWLMVLACMAWAWAFNAALRHAWPSLPVLLRHMANALFLYLAALLPAVYLFLRWHIRSRQTAEDVAASEQEARTYEDDRKQWTAWNDRLGLGSDLAQGLMYLGEWLPAFAILGIVWALLLVGPYLVLSPVLITETLASALAEVLFEFVLAYALIRKIRLPPTATLSYSALFKRSWGLGLLIVLAGFFIGLYQQVKH